MIAYLLKVTLCWLFFYGLYELFLKKRTFFFANRTYLLATLLAGVLLPLLEFIPWKNESNVATVIYPMLVEIDDLQSIVATQEKASFNWVNLIYIVYSVGILVSLSRFLLGFSKILRLFRRSEKQRKSGYTLVLTNHIHLPFSFFRMVFLSKKMDFDQDLDKVMAHELEHIKGNHSLDVLVSELLKVVFWCSPMIYLYKRAIKEVHEFLADHYVVQQSDKISYKKLLLEHTSSGLQLALTHQFFNSHLKNRLKMINQKRSGRPTLVMYALGIPVLLLLLFAFTYAIDDQSSTNNQEQEIIQEENPDEAVQPWNQKIAKEVYNLLQQNKGETASDTVPATSSQMKQFDEVFKVVEQMPRFPGCESVDGGNKAKEECAKQKMLEHIYTTLKYPKEARQKGIEGITVVQFVVTSEGDIENVELIRNIGGGAGAEAVRAVETMKSLPEKWTPGHQRGEAVNVRYVLPVRFKLEGKEEVEEIVEQAEPDANLEKVVAVGYGQAKDESLKEEIEEVKEEEIVFLEISKEAALNIADKELSIESEGDEKRPYLQVDNKEWTKDLEDLDPEAIESINVVKNQAALDLFGDKAKNGAILVYTKGFKGIKKATTKGYSSDQDAKEGEVKGYQKDHNKGAKIVIRDGDNKKPLYVIDGDIALVDASKELSADEIETVTVLKGAKAEEKYGDKGINGVVEITTKDAANTSGNIVKEVDQVAYFPGCSDVADLEERRNCSNQKLLTYVYGNLKYPKKAAKDGIQGTVVTAFKITNEGFIENVHLKRDVKGLSDEALRVVKLMEQNNIQWEPARKDGKAVAMEFVLPIKYKLEDDCDDCPTKVESKIVNCDDITDALEREACREEKKLVVEQAFDKIALDRDVNELALQDFNAYPNPAKDFVNINFKGDQAPLKLQLLDIDGKVILNRNMPNFNGSFSEKFSVEGIDTKMLLLRIEQNSKTFVRKIAVE